jgi:hypothetical protein
MYNMTWGAHTLGTFPPIVFTFRILDFRFLWANPWFFTCFNQTSENGSSESGYLAELAAEKGESRFF